MPVYKVQYTDSSTIHVEAPVMSACSSCQLCPTAKRTLVLPKGQYEYALHEEIELRLSKKQIGGLLFLAFVLPTVLGVLGLFLGNAFGFTEPALTLTGLAGMGLGWMVMALYSKLRGHVFLPQIVEGPHA